MFLISQTIIFISCNFFPGLLKIEKLQNKTKSKVILICYHLNCLLPQPTIKSILKIKKLVTK